MRLFAAILLSSITSLNAATYYIDATGGSDLNNGLSIVAPWQHHPYMANWSGSYSHSAGDTFFFKGGETWGHACFPWHIMDGGTLGNTDSYTSDNSWFSGASFSSPVFDAEGTELPGGYDVMVLFDLAAQPHDIVFLDLDFTRLYWSGNKPFSWVAFINLSASYNISIQYCNFYNWTHGALPTQDQLKCVIGSNSSPYNPGCVLLNCLFDGQNASNSTQGQASGEATYAYSGNVINCTARNMASGFIVTGPSVPVDPQIVSGCEIGPLYVSYDPAAHPDGIFMNGGNLFYWYNNYLHDCYVESIFAGGGSGSEDTYIWNNVIYNCPTTQPIVIDNEYGGARIYVWNNTLVGGQWHGVRVVNKGNGNLGVLDMRNNFFITDAGLLLTDAGISINNLTNQNNLVLGTAQAFVQGYSGGNRYQPTSASAPTVDVGQDLSYLLSGQLTTDILGVPRPTTPLNWVKSFGGTSTDNGLVSTTDTNGNLYIAGNFGGTASFGGSSFLSAGGFDLFLAKYSSSGVHQWSVQYGTTGNEQNVKAISIDGSGNIYIGGYFSGTVNFGGTNMTSAGGNDIFIAKYSSTGTHVWSQQIGGTLEDLLLGLVVNSSGTVYACGNFAGTVNFGGGAVSSTSSARDSFIASYTTAGAFSWLDTFVNNGDDSATGIGLDSTGNVLVSGFFGPTINLGGGSLTSSASSKDIYVGKFTSGGVYTWGKRYGGTNNDASGVATVDTNGDLIVSGTFNQSTDLGGGTLTGNAFSADPFVAKYSGTDGSFQWAKTFGGDLDEGINGLVTDASGSVYAIGFFNVTSIVVGGITLVCKGSQDIFLIKYSTSGSLLLAQGFGGTGSDIGYAVDISSIQDPIIIGSYSGSVKFFQTTLTSLGLSDVFAASLASLWDIGAYEFAGPLGTPGTITLSTDSASVSQSGGFIGITATRSGGTDGDVSITATTADGSAVAGHDYTAVSTNLVWLDGTTGARSFSVPILASGDTATTNRTFTVTISLSSGGATIGTPSVETITIVMPPPPPDAGIISMVTGAASISQNGGSINVGVMRTSGSDGQVDVTIITADDSAVSGHDYTGITNVLTWLDGETGTKTVTIPILASGDTALTNRLFEVFYETTNNVTHGFPFHTIVTILMNAPTVNPGVLALSSSAVSVSQNSGSLTVSVNRSGGTDGAVGVTASTLNGTAQAGHDYTAVTQLLSWGAGIGGSQTFSIPILASGDTATTNRTFTVRLTVPTGGATVGNPSNELVTIIMNAPPPTNGGSFAFSQPSYNTTLGSGTVTITVNHAGNTNIATSLTYNTLDGSAVAGVDYTTTTGTLTWAANDNSSQTFQVPIINTSAVGPNRVFTVTLTNPTGGANLGSPNVAMVSIKLNAPTNNLVGGLVRIQPYVKFAGKVTLGGH